MPIKPEDVTKENVAHIEDYLRSQSDWLLMPDNAQLATLANALIEAGVVSPPVWVGRSTVSGKLLNQTSRKFIKTDGDCIYEHWKGQTE
jgi:hypothetical protein